MLPKRVVSLPKMRASQAGQFVIVCAVYNTSELYLCRTLSDCAAIDSVCLLYSLFKACHLGEAEKRRFSGSLFSVKERGFQKVS